jgi:FixJ family two-component response regulator
MSSKKIDLIESDAKEFMQECSELLDQAETDLLSMDQNSNFDKKYAAIFRVFHSLKGGAGMFGFQALNQHMHHLENDLTNCGLKKSMNSGEISYFLKGIDAAKKILAGQNVTFSYNNLTEEAPLKAKEIEPEVKQITPRSPISIQNLNVLGKIILIDDEPEILEILSDILTPLNFHVEAFNSPEKAIEHFKNKRADVVITDMKMPKMTGIDVLKNIKAIDPDTPVIYISGHLDKKTLIDSIALGVYSALEKPFKEAQIISTTLAALNTSKMFKLLGRSIHLMLYQFADLEDFLKTKGKIHQAQAIKFELENLINYRKSIRELKKAA